MTSEATAECPMYERAPGKLVTHEWELVYPDWNPEKQPLREALCTLGNGYFATRGAFEEVEAGGPHYPGTYLAGGYNRLASEIAGRSIENEDLVNWPNWLPLSFRHADGDWFDLGDVEVLEFRQALDVRCGTLRRTVRFRDGRGRESALEVRRIVSMADCHQAAIEWTLTAENWSGPIEIRTALDGTVRNEGVARYRALNGWHLEPLATGCIGEDGIELSVRTNQSRLTMAQAARTRVFPAEAERERRTVEAPGWIAQIIACECRKQQPLRVEKSVAVYTSRDRAISEPVIESRSTIARDSSFAELLERHSIAWAHLWDRCDIGLGGNDNAQFVLRLHVFHLLQTTSMSTIDLDVGVPSRGLHGEAYRGHIFWDEMFIFPLLNLRIPEVTRALLMYRYRRLPEARWAARAEGYRGAMYPWQSGSNGREESQVLHLNPRSGRWVPDNTYRQRHVNATIAYNVWQYYEATGDAEFLSFYGAEMIVEIARFWASIAHHNPQRDRYEIHGVVGPDEFHTKYPGTEELGLKNNAYTNIMASWVLHCAGAALDRLGRDRRRELFEELALSDEETASWEEIGRKLFVPFHGEGIISQFEGFGDLEEFDWDGYRRKHGDIQRLDRILEAEGDTVNRYQASKQADVLMLFFLFSSAELAEVFERMGYPWTPETIPKNVQYYLHRTSHGSTLSRVVHSWVLARSDRERSWGFFERALASDVADIQGGTTAEGIHLGAMAGTVDLVQRGYTGLETRDDVLWFNPCLPEPLREVHLRIRYRGHWVDVEVTQERLRVRFDETWPRTARVGFRHEIHTVAAGETLEIALSPEC